MPVKMGNKNIKNVKLGNKQVSKIMLGDKQVWSNALRFITTEPVFIINKSKNGWTHILTNRTDLVLNNAGWKFKYESKPNMGLIPPFMYANDEKNTVSVIGPTPTDTTFKVFSTADFNDVITIGNQTYSTSNVSSNIISINKSKYAVVNPSKMTNNSAVVLVSSNYPAKNISVLCSGNSQPLGINANGDLSYNLTGNVIMGNSGSASGDKKIYVRTEASEMFLVDSFLMTFFTKVSTKLLPLTDMDDACFLFYEQ